MAVLLMVSVPGVSGVPAARSDLRDLLGTERCAELQRTLIRRAVAWAARVSPGRVHVAYEPADEEDALRALGVEASLFAQREVGPFSARLGEAVRHVVAADAGAPVLVAWPVLPRWLPEHAEGALDDLRAGCDASVGPVFDGGIYALALARPIPSLFALPAEAWDSPEALGIIIGALNEAELSVGLLRPERGLRGPGDVRAALADPLTDDELRAILGGAGGG